MELFWKTAISLTGIFGLGAFVLYSLYRDWLRLSIFPKLTRAQAYSLFKLFLTLTFLFALSTLAVAAYKSYLDAHIVKREQSAAELGNVIENRHNVGEKVFSEVFADPTVAPEQKAAIRALHTEYSTLTKQARDANKAGNEVQYHEATKQTVRLLESEKAVKALPEKTRLRILSEGCGGDHFTGASSSELFISVGAKTK